MQTSKRQILKAIVAVVCIAAVIIGASVLVIEPMIRSESFYYLDAASRKQQAGSFDFLFIGDSDGMTAFCPSMFDTQTGYTSYNLSGTMMTPESEYVLLKKELSRNPVKRVVLQLSYETFCRDPEREHGDGNSVTIQRMESLGDRADFLANHVDLNQWMDIYSRLLTSGMSFWKDKLSGNLKISHDASSNGWYAAKANDLTLSDEEAQQLLNSKQVSLAFTYDYTREIADVIQLCKEQNTEIFIVILPVSAEHIWKFDGWDGFSDWISSFCEENQVNLYDFNLLKSKNELFSDAVSYKDYAHMSKDGAEAFTTAFGQLMLALDAGEDSSAMFYDTYSEMKEDSPYQQ